MAALLLYPGGSHEGGADQKEDGSLVLPIVWRLKQRSSQDAIAEDRARRDQRKGGESENDAVAQSERIFERRNQRGAGRGGGRIGSIRKRTVHHAETSEASLSNLPAVAVLAP